MDNIQWKLTNDNPIRQFWWLPRWGIRSANLIKTFNKLRRVSWIEATAIARSGIVPMNSEFWQASRPPILLDRRTGKVRAQRQSIGLDEQDCTIEKELVRLMRSVHRRFSGRCTGTWNRSSASEHNNSLIVIYSVTNKDAGNEWIRDDHWPKTSVGFGICSDSFEFRICSDS